MAYWIESTLHFDGSRFGAGSHFDIQLKSIRWNNIIRNYSLFDIILFIDLLWTASNIAACSTDWNTFACSAAARRHWGKRSLLRVSPQYIRPTPEILYSIPKSRDKFFHNTKIKKKVILPATLDVSKAKTIVEKRWRNTVGLRCTIRTSCDNQISIHF